ncbi:MAG: penicillin acylase family protein [bacterium]
MRKILKRAVQIIVGLIAVIAVSGIISGLVAVRRTFPSINGSIAMPSLKKPVMIYRDGYGIPHIVAENEDDLFFAAGYVAAQDRLWQMDLTRRSGRGTLSEIFGRDLLNTDRFIRTMGFARTSEEEAKLLSPTMKDVMERYADGVNAFIEGNPKRLPIEFRILGYRPEPWKPADSILVGKLMSWQLSTNFREELVIRGIVQKVGVSEAADLFPSYPPEGPFIIPDDEIAGSKTEEKIFAGARFLDSLFSYGGGSNSWAVSGRRTETGSPILANDPHLSSVRVPTTWYQIHLKCPTLDVVGVTLPGIPVILIGHNARIAWGITNGTIDVQDTYLERIAPGNPPQVRMMGEWKDVEVIDERITYRDRRAPEGRGFLDDKITITPHGPIITDLEGLREPISLRWIGNDPSPSDIEAFYEINKARDWDEFTEGLRKFGAAPQNFVYADVDGNIGYHLAGRVPIRAQESGLTTSDGWDGEHEWRGYIPFDKLPKLYNPKRGYIATANAKVISDPKYPYTLTTLTAPPYRTQRIIDLIEGKDKLSVKDVERMQMDNYSIPAAEITPILIGALERAKFPDKIYTEAIEYLRNWNYKEDAESVGAAIYNTTFRKLSWLIFQDEFGRELTEQYLDSWYLSLPALMNLIFKGGPWFDDRNTPEIETRNDIIIRAFEEAVKSLKSEYGGDIKGWKWGRLHTVRFDHPMGKAIPFLSRGPFPAPGGNETLNRGLYKFTEPFEATSLPSMRMIVSLEKDIRSEGMIPLGQVGQPFRRHYDDMTELWLSGRYIPWYLDEAEMAARAEGKLILKPSP